MKDYLLLAEKNQARAWKVIRSTRVVELWEEAGAEVNLVGSLKLGLLMKHRDIDFHIYSRNLTAKDSFAVMSELSACPHITQITCSNLLNTPEQCIEWHALYQDPEDGEKWQIDMIHMPKGSAYDGYFEQVADRIARVLTDETRDIILRLKYETPDDEKIMGIEYYQAVIAGGISTWQELVEWRKAHPVTGIVSWMPSCGAKRP